MNNSTMNQVLETLHNPRTIRKQAQRILDLAKCNQLDHFTLDPEKMTSTASFIIDVMTNQYPDLNIPYHSRWRHFEAGGINRIKKLQEHISNKTTEERGKILYELAIISVFLDAGAGNVWSYTETETGNQYTRSEGLALASLALYQKGAFSSNPQEPLRIDAKALIDLNETMFSEGFQISPENPLEGLNGRVSLLNRLGNVLEQNKLCFGEEGRLGNFYSYVSSRVQNKQLSAEVLFEAVLLGFNAVWPIRLVFNETSLGDVGIHKALKTSEIGSEFVPFHKLSQWLTYSLIEPLEQTGIAVTHLDTLTGLPEYRNGGLLIDSGLLQLKNPAISSTPQDPSSELIVEWRALTVALLDELAVLIRQKLHKNAETLPLAKILQGGTWEAGRRIAKQKRSQGTPPIHIISDGTVF